jgi:hypothetical protein
LRAMATAHAAEAQDDELTALAAIYGNNFQRA